MNSQELLEIEGLRGQALPDRHHRHPPNKGSSRLLTPVWTQLAPGACAQAPTASCTQEQLTMVATSIGHALTI